MCVRVLIVQAGVPLPTPGSAPSLSTNPRLYQHVTPVAGSLVAKFYENVNANNEQIHFTKLGNLTPPTSRFTLTASSFYGVRVCMSMSMSTCICFVCLCFVCVLFVCMCMCMCMYHTLHTRHTAHYTHIIWLLILVNCCALYAQRTFLPYLLKGSETKRLDLLKPGITPDACGWKVPYRPRALIAPIVPIVPIPWL